MAILLEEHDVAVTPQCGGLPLASCLADVVDPSCHASVRGGFGVVAVWCALAHKLRPRRRRAPVAVCGAVTRGDEGTYAHLFNLSV
jgi:hypothetical protein